MSPPGWPSCCRQTGNWAWRWDTALWGSAGCGAACGTTGYQGVRDKDRHRQHPPQPHAPGLLGAKGDPKQHCRDGWQRRWCPCDSLLSPAEHWPPAQPGLEQRSCAHSYPNASLGGTPHPKLRCRRVLGAILALDRAARHESCQPSTSCRCLGAHLARRARRRSQGPCIPFSRTPSLPPAASPAPGEPSGLNIQEHSLCTFCKDQAALRPGNSLPLLPGMRLNECAE